MNNDTHHISVCVCTYKRPQYLKRLLEELGGQETRGLFTFSVVVADNDRLRSAAGVVSQFVASSSLPVRYCVEPQQNVPLVRNRAIENATGDLIAFLDDDEFPAPRWLLTLFEACAKYHAAGVLGPVKPYFDERAPEWVIKGNFYRHPNHPTGYVIDWDSGRTGNVLFRTSILAPGEPAFRSEFQGGGADKDFFRRMIEKGYVFVWCQEAVAFEVIPPVRWKRSFMLRRALLRGWAARLHPTFGSRDVAKSLIALPTYALALPFALALGHHKFMRLLIRSCDHIGRLLALVGIRAVKAPYVTE